MNRTYDLRFRNSLRPVLGCRRRLIYLGFDASVVLGHKAGIDKFDGYSEAWTKQSLNVTSIKQILDWVYEDEAK